MTSSTDGDDYRVKIIKKKMFTYKAWNSPLLFISSLILILLLAAAIRVFVFPPTVESNVGTFVLYAGVFGAMIFSIWCAFAFLDERR